MSKNLALLHMEVQKNLLVFGFFALMLFKVSSAHVCIHHHEDTAIEDCFFCDHAVANQSAEFIPPPAGSFFAPFITSHPSKVSEAIPFTSIAPSYYQRLFTRPPPSF